MTIPFVGWGWPHRVFTSRQRSLFESMFDQCLQLAGESLIEPKISADRIINVAIRVEHEDFFRGRGNKADNLLCMVAAHRVNHVGLVNQLYRERPRTMPREVGAQRLERHDG